MDPGASRPRFPWPFFLLLLLLSLPFWLASALTRRLQLPVELPIGALQALNPALAALILVAREKRPGGVRALLARAFDFKRIERKAWYLPILGLWPLGLLLVYLLMKAQGAPLPEPVVPILLAPPFLLVFFLVGATEELGWQGYLYDRLPAGWGALGSALAIGIVWAAWHIPPFSTMRRDSSWILWQLLAMIPFRILIVWLFNNTGKSVFAASLFHAMSNVSQFLFPNFGSHYDPFRTFFLLSLCSIVAIALWGPRTLSRFRGSIPRGVGAAPGRAGLLAQAGAPCYPASGVSMKEATLRDFAAADFEGLGELWAATGVGDPARGDSLESIERSLGAGARLLLLEEEGLIVGSCWLTDDARRLYVHHMAVSPDRRRRGYGERLLREAIRIAAERGLQMKLEVHAENAGAIALYKKLGFDFIGDYELMLRRRIG